MTSASIGYVIPVVHPDSKNVVDYDVVERMLKLTLRSLAAQSSAGVVVVSFRRPSWADEFAGIVRFIEVGNHPGFAPGLVAAPYDKGKKDILGIHYLLAVANPDYIMLIDADDFISTSLPATIGKLENVIDDAFDAFVIRNGYHVRLVDTGAQMDIEGVFRVQEFNISCGSCRIFKSNRLVAAIQKREPELHQRLQQLMAQYVEHPSTETLWGNQTTDDLVKRSSDQSSGFPKFIRLIGRHKVPDGEFSYYPIQERLAAKGCGHGNHEGHRGGSIHWHKVQGTLPVQRFLDEFGLAKAADLKAKVNPTLHMFWWLLNWKTRILRALR